MSSETIHTEAIHTEAIHRPAGTGGAQRVSWWVLGVGGCVSVLIHLGVGVGSGEYFSRSWMSADKDAASIEMADDDLGLIPLDEDLKLGMDEAQTASINWLGVVDDAVEGNAPVAEVEQAEFTTRLGNAEVTAGVEPGDVLTPPDLRVVEAVESVEKPIEEPIEEPEVEVAEAEAVEVTRDESTAEQASEQVDLEIELVDEDVPEVVIQEAEVEEAADADEVVDEPVIEEPVGPSLVSVEPVEVEPGEVEPVEEVADPVEKVDEPADVVEPVDSVEVPNPSGEASPAVAGKVGELTDRESSASIIKRAIKVNASKLNRPIVGKGLEISTVDPRFPASVRFTQLPRNPVLMIRFDNSGRVSKVGFLKEGLKVFDTGSSVVDEPLINAVYQWRAKGKEIDALDPEDAEAFIEISMRILFRKDEDLP